MWIFDGFFNEFKFFAFKINLYKKTGFFSDSYLSVYINEYRFEIHKIFEVISTNHHLI